MSLSRLAAVVVLALVPAALAGDEPAPLKFAWPVPSKATVTEKILRNGKNATTRYTVSLERAGSGDDLRLHVADFEFLEFDGRAANDPAIAGQIQAALPMAKAIPDLLIGADGSLKDVLDIDKTIATVIDELTKVADDRLKASLPAFRAQLESPASRQAMRREWTKHWISWVVEWAGRTIPEGKGVEATHPVRCPDSTEVAAPTQYRRIPGGSEGPGFAKFTRESVLDGEDAKAAFDTWVTKAEAALGKSLGATGMRLVDRVVAVTDPLTLRPKWVRREEQRILHMKDGADRNDIERHEYDFEWPAASPPKAPESGK